MISGYGELIRDFPQEYSRENVQVIIDEANRLASLVNNLLDISKLQSGNQQLNLSVIDAEAFVRDAVSNYGKLAESLKITVKLNAEGGNMYFKGDRERLMQVFSNLLNNAVNHAGSDDLVIVNYLVKDGYVRYEVIDHGEGIAQEDLEKIWERYYKVDKQHVRSRTGSGLGLSIVKTILELHHGLYGVESKKGEGACFWFALPAIVEAEEVKMDE